MTTNQLKNLISYHLLMLSDNNYQSNLDYIIEKYDMFFTEQPNKFNTKVIIDNIETIPHYDDLIKSMDRWGIKKDTNGFIKYFFTYYSITTVNKNDEFIKDLTDFYFKFFNDSSSIVNEQRSYVLHPLLRIALDRIVFSNKLFFRNLFVRELSNKSK